MRTILLLGDYSGRSAGHNALLMSIINEFDNHGSYRFFVPTLRSVYLKKVLDGKPQIFIVGVEPRNLSIKFLGKPVINLIKKVDCVLLTDNLLFDTGFFNPLMNSLLALVLITKYAKHLSKPLIYYNSGVGPANTPWGRLIIRHIVRQFDFVALRDDYSKSVLSSVAPDVDPVITADSGFNMPRGTYESISPFARRLVSRLSKESGWLGVNLSYHLFSHLEKLRISGISKDEIIRRIATTFTLPTSLNVEGIVFFVTHPKDRQVTMKLADHLKGKRPCIIIDQEQCSVQDMAFIATHLMCVIGSRYHELVMFLSHDVPILGINYSMKIFSLLDSLKSPQLLLEPESLLHNNGPDLLGSAVEKSCQKREALFAEVEKKRLAAAGAVSFLAALMQSHSQP